MTTLQIKVAIATKESGSISAAKEPGISQPNAGNYIKALENEVGFPIFHRAKLDTTLTEKGHIFLKHAGLYLHEGVSVCHIPQSLGGFRFNRLQRFRFYPVQL